VIKTLAKKNTFSLYMAKNSNTPFDDLLTDKAREKLARGHAYKLTSDDFADGAALYVFPGQRKPPPWAEQLQGHFELKQKLFNQSHSAILVFKKDNAVFAVTFSYGHVFLDNARTEADFGLKVAINFVSDEKLRSVERSNIGAAIRDIAHAAGQKDLHAFGFDDALDLIRKVSGYAAESDFADKVTGARALAFTKEIEISEVPDLAVEAVGLFNSQAYKSTSFRILDFLSPVSDPAIQDALDHKLVEAIRQGSDEFEIGLPEIVHDGVGSYRFERAGFAHFYPDLSLDLYRDGLGERLKDLSLADVKKHQVAVYAADGSRPLAHWAVHYALVGSVAMNGARYALNEGLWYRIDDKYKQAADDEFDNLCGAPDKKLRPLKKIYPEGGKKSGRPVYQSERSYNEEVAAESDYLLLDDKLIPIENTPGRGIEACDLIDLGGHRLIHVKKSSRRSSVLSHFFKQGSNSAQLMRKYQSFAAGLVEIVKDHYGEATATELNASLDARQDKWTVEFQIADFPRENGQHNIPFFSKLSLRDEAHSIRAMGFNVKLGFITLAKIQKDGKAAKVA
jgi:uncharacterized protein (TIGR04141 family)